MKIEKRTMRKIGYSGIIMLLLLQQAESQVTVYSAPKEQGVALSDSWVVHVNGISVPVYRADVYRDGPACFCSFDFSGPVEVCVRPMMECTSPVLRPLSAGITPVLNDHHTITFKISSAGQYSLEPRHYTSGQPLLIFANPPEENVPDPTDPSVLYYGPGYHEITKMPIGNKTTVYLAGGAYLKNVVPDDEEPIVECDGAGMPRFRPMVYQKGRKNITIRGRGIVDFSAVPWHGRQPFVIQSCTNIMVEGITVIDSPSWVFAIGASQNVLVSNVKIIGHRENSDGIDIVSSRNVTVTNCFVRTGDDGICVKTITGPANDITVEHSVVWNDRVRGIGITGESMYSIKDITFRDIDIIHDLTTFSRGFSLAVYIEQSGPVEHVLFDDIRVEDTRNRLIQVEIGNGALNENSAEIRDVTFRNVQYSGRNMPMSVVSGAGQSHDVRNILFENLVFHGRKALSAEDANMKIGNYTKKVLFK